MSSVQYKKLQENVTFIQKNNQSREQSQMTERILKQQL
jgi:hypothetical protein